MILKNIRRLQAVMLITYFAMICSVSIGSQLVSAQAVTAQPNCDKGKMWCPSANTCINANDICILEPVPGGPTTISSTDTPDLGAMLKYINGGLWTWALRIAVAITVGQGAVAGLQIVTKGPDEVAQAKERFRGAIIGLLLLLMAGAILQFLNPFAFSQ